MPCDPRTKATTVAAFELS